MRAGLLNEVITILRNEVITDEYGANKIEWNEFVTTRANITYNSGNRITENSEIVFTTAVDFTIRTYHKVEPKMRILYRDNLYRIMSIEVDMQKQKQIIKTELINE